MTKSMLFFFYVSVNTNLFFSNNLHLDI